MGLVRADPGLCVDWGRGMGRPGGEAAGPQLSVTYGYDEAGRLDEVAVQVPSTPPGASALALRSLGGVGTGRVALARDAAGRLAMARPWVRDADGPPVQVADGPRLFYPIVHNLLSPEGAARDTVPRIRSTGSPGLETLGRPADVPWVRTADVPWGRPSQRLAVGGRYGVALRAPCPPFLCLSPCNVSIMDSGS